MDREEKIARFRNAFKALDLEDREREILRITNPSQLKRHVILVDWENNSRYKFPDVNELIRYLKHYKNIQANKSNIYKVLRGERQSAYGFKMYYEGEDEF